MVARAASVAGALLAMINCGSRTGLFGPDEGLLPIADASDGVDGPTGTDGASADGRVDGSRDGRTDARIDAAPDGPVACIPGTFGFGLATSQLMFVLDRSRSMRFVLDDDREAEPDESSRWDVLHQALEETIVPFSDQIAMGARFFPGELAGNTTVNGCVQDSANLAIAPALTNAETILDVFLRTGPMGGTPTAPAIELAAVQLSASRAVARAMVVATDGAPNCNPAIDPYSCICTSPCGTDGTNCLDDVRAIDTVGSVFVDRKIPVYVIGIGVTAGFAATLDGMAVAGGRPRAGLPRYYSADTPGELRDAFTVVRDSVARCSYITPSSPENPDAIAVVVGGASVPRDPTHADGWDWIDQAYGHLQLFGPACTAATPANVSGTVACPDPDR